MPTTKKGAKIKSAMKKHYGAKKGEQVFHASKNKGTIKGVEKGGGARRKKSTAKSKRTTSRRKSTASRRKSTGRKRASSR